MRNSIFSILFFSLFFLVVEDLKAQESSTTPLLLADSNQVLAYPLDVMKIIDTKCLGCHSPEGRSEKSRNALQWVILQSMDAVDQVAKLDEIVEVLEEGTMPPEKIVAKYPHLKMTEEETIRMKKWAETTLTKLLDE